MINEELTGKTINFSTRSTQVSSRAIIKMLKLLLRQSNKNGKSLKALLDDKYKSNKLPLRKLVGKGQLEEIPIVKQDLKELKKQLNKHGVNFSVMKEKGKKEYTLFFQSSNTVVMDKAFKKAIANSEKKIARKNSTLEKIQKLKDKVKGNDAKLQPDISKFKEKSL